MNPSATSSKLPEKNAVYIDMDDTLHEAESHVMAECWNKLLSPWGIVWKAKNGEPRDPHLRYVQEDERPGVGILPRNVIKHFINLYGLDPGEADPKLLKDLGLDDKEMDVMTEIWGNTEKETLSNVYSFLLEQARVRIPEQIVESHGIQPIEGAVARIQQLRESGFAIAVITSGSKIYALKVLHRLGILHSEEFPEPGMMPESDLIDALITGEEVLHPKPHEEPKLRADDEIQKKYPGHEIKVRAMIGDSRSDGMLAFNTGIPKAFIRNNEYLKDSTRSELETTLGPRLNIFDSWNEITPESILEMKTSVEGQHGPGPELR